MSRVSQTLVAVAVLSTFSCHRYWGDADAFRQELRCGMTPAEVQALAAEHGSSGFFETTERRADAPTHFVREGSTSFSFWVSDGRLEWFKQGRYFGTTGLQSSLRVNLCTGERTGYPTIHVNAPPKFKGGDIYLDGRELGGLSTGDNASASASIGVPIMKLGQHELRIVKPGFAPVVRKFVYQPVNFWPEEAINFEVEPSELRRSG